MKFSRILAGWALATFCLLPAALAQTTNLMATNLVTTLPMATPLPDIGPSVMRVMGALALVIALFLGGVWLFRNWQRLTIQRGRVPKLNVIETRSLGGRQALYVIGYEQSRFLITASPSGVSLLSHLPDAGADEAAPETKPPPPFSVALAQMLKGK